MHSSLGLTVICPGAWTLAKNIFQIKQTKSGTLTKEITKEFEVKAYGAVLMNKTNDLGQLHNLAINQSGYFPYLMDCCPLNIGASKHKTTFHINKWH